MGDENDDWFTSMDEEPAPAPEPEKKGAKGAKPSEAAPQDQKEAAQSAEEQAQQEEAAAEDEYLDPDKLILFKHWIRPKFLQYNYLYDYQHSYYNDVIDYLDRKSRGLNSEIPRPQTWAERALRTYVSKIDKLESYRREIEEKLKMAKKIEKKTRRSTFISYHSKEYMSRRVSSMM
ncbi:flightin isoform X1 [Coccinella septempunctata]|uniref:flightin isoform X1 n=1 Tax=Coccinella septempunctata TaxID=41139 RepID=UPI001D0683B3|nr:flightin isoform X1 [Coccinella septempunctata]XP_044763140.1 flightin isoform X1 [Coccinella septempunctata]XP_044763148.1 flightin isoform X1 [Coccinella septempunctata]